MKLNNVIVEKHYIGPLYHSTSYESGLSILESGHFKLVGPVYPYKTYSKRAGKEMFWMSVSRDKMNSFRNFYHNDIVFVLDGNMITRDKNIRLKPIDYFAPTDIAGLAYPDEFQRSEAEERIYSYNKELIHKSFLSEIHVNAPRFKTYDSMVSEKISVMANKLGIPIYFYKNRNSSDFQLLNKKNTKRVFIDENNGNQEYNMLVEKNYSAPLYHITNAFSFNRILTTGLEFSNAMESPKEKELMPTNKKYQYYLSTSRSLVNAFRNVDNYAGIGSKMVSLVLNTQYFNNKDFLIKPVNYFADTDGFHSHHLESEERIWSKKEWHDHHNCINEVHIMYTSSYHDIIQRVKSAIDKTNIKYYMYENEREFIIHNKRKAKYVGNSNEM